MGPCAQSACKIPVHDHILQCPFAQDTLTVLRFAASGPLRQCEQQGVWKTGTYFAFASGRKQDKMRIGNALRHAAASSFGIALSIMLASSLLPADAVAEGVGGVAL